MEMSSDEEKQNKQDLIMKPKRQMKTPFQLQTLEKAYAEETYPSEETRLKLSEKLDLTDRQLQMWFCHKRLKDKNKNTLNKLGKVGPLPPESSSMEKTRAMGGHESTSDYGSVTGSGSSHFMEPKRVVLDDGSMTRRFYGSPPRQVMEVRIVACIEEQLGEPLREDGPVLGMEFDPLPPDAFGAPIAEMMEQLEWSKYPYEDKLNEQHYAKSSKDRFSIRPHAYGQAARSSYCDPSVNSPRGRASLFVHGHEPLSRVYGVTGQMSRVRLSSQQDKKGPENTDACCDVQIFQNDADLRLDRKHKSVEARIAREAETHKNRFSEEHEKQDNMRWKTIKEMECHDRETWKEEERLIHGTLQEERSMHVKRHELERREKAGKKKQKEELRREFEAVKHKADKAAARRTTKESFIRTNS